MVVIEVVKTAALLANRLVKKKDIVRHSHAGGNPYLQIVDTCFTGMTLKEETHEH